jgi:thiamine pyrophosphokinase
VYALQKHDCFVIFPINPSTLAKYREAFQSSRAKDDPTDAELAVDLILRHPERVLNHYSHKVLRAVCRYLW